MTGMGDLKLKEASASMTQYSDRSVPVVYLDRTPVVGLFPIRYALGDNGSETPDIEKSGGSFKVEDSSGKPIPCQGNAHYTLRRLRPGYLHVFREKDKKWSIFSVKADGRMEPFLWDAKQGGLPGPLKNLTPDRVDALRSRLEVLRYTPDGLLFIPENVPVWLCFCDAPMTQKTLDKARDEESFRSRHMRRFDPKAWAGKTHTASFGEKGKRATAPDQKQVPPVADLCPGIDKNAFWFSGSPFPQIRINELKAGVSDPTAVKDWAVLALEDPVGMMSDLASLMAGRFEDWSLQPAPNCPGRTNKWAFMAGSAIAGIKATIEDKAARDTTAADLAVYNQDVGGERLAAQMYGVDPAKEKQWETYYNKNFQTKLDKDIAQDKTFAWRGYSEKYKVAVHEAWMKDYPTRLEGYDKDNILPLAKMHVAWAESARFKAYFDGVFDSSDAGSGVFTCRP